MTPFIRKYIFAGKDKSAFAPHVFLILCVYTVMVSVYTRLFFDTDTTIVRIVVSVLIIIVYIVIERSPLKTETLSFLTPMVVIALLTGAAIYFRGDFLLFTYNICAAIISLTYLKPKGLAAYIAAASLAQGVILLVFKQNLLGAAFTMVYNYLYLCVAVAMSILVYIFCRVYSRTVSALTEAKNEANQASLAKGTFLSNMSHEIRTPMNAIIGMTAIGKMSDKLDQAHYALNKIGDASAHLLGIINDVLDMSKIESGKFDLSLVKFSFEKMLQRMIDVNSFRLEEKNQNLYLYVDENIPPVLIGDDQRLAQVLTNLLGNAVKFTPTEGTVFLNASLLSEENDFCTIQIEVVDSGIGISPEQQSRLFQSFQQADRNTSRFFGGTGLGLAISKSLVELMGGKIWVNSELGKGATFAFTFQARRCDSREFDYSSDDADWNGLRVLAVDDNSGILGYLKSFVEGYGALCDIVPCGADATSLARRNAYHIFFVDWKMSDIDGLHLVRQLKAIQNAPATAVIMISSIDWSDIEETARNAGVDRFLAKPLFPSAIADIINDFLNAARQQISSVVNNIPADYSDKCILIAEDDEVNREILASLFQPMNLKLVCTENGAAAIRAFSEAPDVFDMILMDVHMPEMDGYEATRHIRSLDALRAKTVPIIAMTADVFREDIELCLEAGMNGHLGKPLEFQKVLDVLRDYIS